MSSHTNRFALAGVVAAALAASAVVLADAQVPESPPPTPQHQWLKQLIGEWETVSEMSLGPGQDPIRCTGTETVRPFGEFWVISEMKGQLPTGEAMEGRVTMGYDPDAQAFVGTWIDTSLPHMWVYNGSLDDSGKILTLHCDGPDFTQPGKTAKYKDVTEFKSPDHRVVTSWAQGTDGNWVQFASIDFTRKK